MTGKISHLERRRRFDALVRELRPDLYRYAFWLSRSRSVADDVVQEALLRAWKAFGDIRDTGSTKQWLVTIVRRENARLYERKRLDTVDISDYEEEIAATSDDDPDLGKMRQAIFRLDDAYREPLALQVLLGHSTREIAELTGLNEATVLTRVHRARHRLKLEMGIESEDGPGDGS